MLEPVDIYLEVREHEVIVSSPAVGFEAVYFKASGNEETTLRRHSATDDFRLLVRVRQTLNSKAGWAGLNKRPIRTHRKLREASSIWET